MRAIAEVMMNEPHNALNDLANPAIGDEYYAPLWRALAFAGLGKWAQARDGFNSAESAIAKLPVELQRTVLVDATRADVEVGDFAGAAEKLDELQSVGVPPELQAEVSILRGRYSEGIGRSADALAAYEAAAKSTDRAAASQGELRETALRYALGQIKSNEVMAKLEMLTTIWRGDETEMAALQLLGRLYAEQGRFRDSFNVFESATQTLPDSDITRRIQNDAAGTFEQLFLGGKAEALPAVDALALFYDFRELTPIGRRGDRIIRYLADRLVSLDLLDQAAALLQYQVNKRLEGAARAEVGMRLAVIYLMNHKADHALATLRATRTGDLANELRTERILLEARALSDVGRHDLALQVIANIAGPEAIRLRADILWNARRWARAAEQIELYYGRRWSEWKPLNEIERVDILRAAVGYAVGEDALGLGRLREKYAAKMAQTPDAHAFAVASAPLGPSSSSEFAEIARAISSVDTLQTFLRALQERYPDDGAVTAVPPSGAQHDTGDETGNGTPQPQPQSQNSEAGPSSQIGRQAAPRDRS
jgi:hypothetical protein